MLRSRFLALLLLLCAASPLAAQAPLPVMSFNVRYGTANDGDDAWPHRRHLVLRTIRDAAPAVLGIQEALRFQLDEIRAAEPRFAEIGVGRDDGRTAGEYAAILYDGTRLEALEQGWFWLSDTPDVPGSKTWGNNVTRIVTWARLRERASGAAFYFFNTHWDHESQPARERSARLLLERIAARAHPDPVIVTADFNAGESNPAFRTLTGDARVPLRDTFRVLHSDAADVGTFHAFRGGTAADKIDAVLVGEGWEVLAAEIRHDREGTRHPSDHHPVTALLRLRGAGE